VTLVSQLVRRGDGRGLDRQAIARRGNAAARALLPAGTRQDQLSAPPTARGRRATEVRPCCLRRQVLWPPRCVVCTSEFLVAAWSSTGSEVSRLF